MILDLGLMDYGEAYKIQKELVERRKRGEIDDTIIVVEHPPVFTIGRIGKKDNLLVDEGTLLKSGIKFLNVDRGGDITFHGPGQLVIYPIIDLKNRSRDLHRYIRDLEEAVIRLLAGYSIAARRIIDRTGVWVGDRKIAFIGIAASNWVAYHGLSLNINVGKKYFSMIRPCGLEGVETISMDEILHPCPGMTKIKEEMIAQLYKTLGMGGTVAAEYAFVA